MKFYSTITSRGPSTVITSHYRIPLLLLFASLFLSTNAQTTTTPSDSNSDPNSTVDNSGDDSATSGPDANGVCYKDPPTNQDVVPCAVRTHNTASGVNVVPIVIGVVAGCVVVLVLIAAFVIWRHRVRAHHHKISDSSRFDFASTSTTTSSKELMTKEDSGRPNRHHRHFDPTRRQHHGSSRSNRPGSPRTQSVQHIFNDFVVVGSHNNNSGSRPGSGGSNSSDGTTSHGGKGQKKKKIRHADKVRVESQSNSKGQRVVVGPQIRITGTGDRPRHTPSALEEEGKSGRNQDQDQASLPHSASDLDLDFQNVNKIHVQEHDYHRRRRDSYGTSSIVSFHSITDESESHVNKDGSGDIINEKLEKQRGKTQIEIYVLPATPEPCSELR